MRLGLLVIVLAACSAGGAASAGRAWPKATVREVDGGESLAPRAAARVIAAVVEVADDERPADKAASDKPAPATSGGTGSADKPAATTPSATPPADEPITTEDIVIEIED